MNRFVPTCSLAAPLFFLLFFIFAPTAHATWYDSNYQYCIPLTMTAGGTSGGVATTTTNGFALVATSTISTLAATSSAGHVYTTGTGGSATTSPIDFVVTNGTDCNDDGGSPLDFYFETYKPTTGQFVLWVEPDDISSTTAKTILMYYGYADNSATNQANENDVFGGLDEVGVWDMREDPNTAGANGITDSTSNANHGTYVGSGVGDLRNGQIGNAIELDINDSDYIQTLSEEMDGADEFSYSMWINADVDGGAGDGGRNHMLWEGDVTANGCGDEAEFSLLFGDCASGGFHFQTQVYIEDATGGDLNLEIDHTEGTYIGTWHLFTLRLTNLTTAMNAQLYIDGQLVQSATAGSIDYTGWDTALRIGGEGAVTRTYDGRVDDVRAFSRPLHAMDILTIYNNTRSSTIFWTFGDEETEAVVADTTPTRKVHLFEGFTIKFTSGRVILYQR